MVVSSKINTFKGKRIQLILFIYLIFTTMEKSEKQRLIETLQEFGIPESILNEKDKALQAVFYKGLSHKLRLGIVEVAKRLVEAAEEKKIDALEPIMSDQRSDDEFHQPKSFITFGVVKARFNGNETKPTEINVRSAFKLMEIFDKLADNAAKESGFTSILDSIGKGAKPKDSENKAKFSKN